jgi:hypothetical protein
MEQAEPRSNLSIHCVTFEDLGPVLLKFPWRNRVEWRELPCRPSDANLALPLKQRLKRTTSGRCKTLQVEELLWKYATSCLRC